MPSVPRHGDLEIEQDPVFQRRDWRMQRIGRIAMLGFVLAALAGVFGAGPVARASARSSDGRLEVGYNRIARHGAPEPLRVRVAPSPAGDSIIDLWIDQQYAHGLLLHGVSPEPVEMRAGETRLVYRFRVVDPSRPADIIFDAEAGRLWGRRGTVGLVNGDSVRFRQFVLP